MISTRHFIASMLVAAAAPAALLIASGPAAAKGGGGGGKWVEVGPIWNQQDAENKCPKAARRQGMTWSGQWKTTVPGQMSKCQLSYGQGGGGRGKMVEVGPIWNQADAEVKCQKAARKSGGIWSGQWRTTRQGIMSECEIKNAHATGLIWPEPKKDKGSKWMIEVGPIWNQTDAELKCLRAASQAGAQWTGQWKTTRPGQMSVCEVRR